MHHQKLPVKIDWFKRYKSGNFDTEDKVHFGTPKTIEDSETANGHRYQQRRQILNHALLEKRSNGTRERTRAILQQDITTCHSTSIIQHTIKTLKLDVPPHLPNFLDLVSSAAWWPSG
ncbi:hypothetical protein CEXT_598891 [Caerostris extrusa]|uniref:Transposase n=1 Tax=Caerostris extrusa TaxID=172846 RepID=A0AAV4N032_CAEEX|nr:hypothetical protein CEXT_598891 [Caerostris extrusa]